jgi:hypothetical protein
MRELIIFAVFVLATFGVGLLAFSGDALAF